MEEPGRLQVHGVAKSETRLSNFTFTFVHGHLFPHLSYCEQHDSENGSGTISSRFKRVSKVTERNTEVRNLMQFTCMLSSFYCPLLRDERNLISLMWSFPGGTSGREPACQCGCHKRCRFDPWGWEDTLEECMQPTPVFLLGEPDRQRSLEDQSPQGHKESDMIEAIQQSTQHITLM